MLKELADFPPQPRPAPRIPLSKEKSVEVRAAFQAFLGGLTEILQKREPEQWLPLVYRYLLKTQKQLDSFDPHIRQYLHDYLDEIFDLLREQSKQRPKEPTEIAPDVHAQAAQEFIHKMEHVLVPEGTAEREFTIHRISLEDLLVDRIHFGLGEAPGPEGQTMPVFNVRAAPGEPWYPLPLPPSEQIMHKGGTLRVILKILSGAPLELIKAELPPNDFDVIASGDQKEMQRQAIQMGVDIEGVEHVQEFGDLTKLFAGRDLDLNQCFFGKNGLTYTEQALKAARTGEISLQAEDRGLYGSEKLYFDGVELGKNRGVQRLLKFVAEGKATSFEFTPLNEQLDLGIYWLLLARKFAKKKNSNELLDRLYFLGDKIKQVREGESNVIDVLDRVHTEYPFFRMEDSNLDQTGLAKWLGGKMAKLADRRFRMEQGISLGLELEREPGDTIPYEVSLEDYADEVKDLKEAWEAFVKRCHARTEAYHGALNELDKDTIQLKPKPPGVADAQVA